MPHAGFTSQYRAIGRVAACAVCWLEVAYAITTVLGLLALQSPSEPIGDPFFLIMELLIILIVPLMVIVMVVVHLYAAPEDKAYSLIALMFMLLVAGITSSVHFIVLTVGRSIESDELIWHPLFFSFQWPSVVYALDILAWDWFFALSMFSAAVVFKRSRWEIAVRSLMIVSGVLSLIGLIGVPLANMQIRNIGIIGYGGVAPIMFLLLSLVFKQTIPSSNR
ncbi:MAG: hypothetical protein MUF72_14340 [Elainella sp. Prado103]|nr:hypothetical protein [Elainella sp. Prado103]